MMDAKQLEKEDPTFPDDLIRSLPANWHVAQWYSSRGLTVLVPPTKVRPKVEQRLDYRDDGDFFIRRDVPGWKRIEVKWFHKDATWTTARDFPHKNILIDACATYDAKDPFPDQYVIINDPLTHAFVINVASTRDVWFRLLARNKDFGGRKKVSYFVPVDLATFHEVTFPWQIRSK